MRGLSPLLQTDEIKEAINTAIQEHTRARFGAHESSAGADGGQENRLLLIRKIISGEIDYSGAVKEHGLSNNVIVDVLLNYGVISDPKAQDMKRGLRKTNTPKTFIPHT